MTLKEFSEQLNGRIYKHEMTEQEIGLAEENQFVVVLGFSDDTTLLRGAIKASLETRDGGVFYITEEGLFEDCPCDCIHCQRAREKAYKVSVDFCKGPYVWAYTTDIPHETFDIIDNQPAENLKFCQGMVFDLRQLKETK